MHTFPTSWKHQKTLRFSDIFREYRKGALGKNALKMQSTKFSVNSK